MPVSPLGIISEIAGPPAGQRILDVGCGNGSLAVALAEAGYITEGVEPGSAAIALARRGAPHLVFHQSGAERLPLEDAAFDIVTMVNALHHVPRPLMQQAIAEALRVLKPAGALVVIEPGVTGSFFEALRPIEDETEVRGLAQLALDEATESGAWRTLRSFGYGREERFAAADDFIARAVAVDPARHRVVDRNRSVILKTFARHAVPETGGGYMLVQPIIVRVLAPA